MTFVSIVVPTFNRAHLIVPTIESILEQDNTDFEIIIVDDGSACNSRCHKAAFFQLVFWNTLKHIIIA